MTAMNALGLTRVQCAAVLRTYRERVEALSRELLGEEAPAGVFAPAAALEAVAYQLEIDVLALSTGEASDRIGGAEASVLVPVLRRVRHLLSEARSGAATDDLRRALAASRELLAVGETQANAWTA
jgi:hypothetical protein